MPSKPSSVINSSITDGADLIVEFKNGKCFRYAGAADLYGALNAAESKGAFFNANVKGKFEASQV
jgi:hypothetical protein